MRLSLAAFALAAALAIGSDARAQVARGTTVVGTEYVVGAPYPGHNAVPALSRLAPTPAPGAYHPPYSYYAAPYPYPARYYVGYGANDPPFYGRPYGTPNDPWSWSAMGESQRSLARYFYPPL